MFSGRVQPVMPEEAPSSHHAALYIVLPLGKFLISAVRRSSCSLNHNNQNVFMISCHLLFFSLLPIISAPWPYTLLFLCSFTGHGCVWSSAAMETVASKEHELHPLRQPGVPENHRGRNAHLQERFWRLRLPRGSSSLPSENVFLQTVSFTARFYNVPFFSCRGKWCAWTTWTSLSLKM